MNWEIIINNFLGGFAPAWYKETYPSFGNKNQAGTMTNIDLTNAGYLIQGPGFVNLTNSSAATTLVKGMVDAAVSSGFSYGVGGAKLYQFSSTTVTNSGSWPHTIDKAVVTAEDGESVVHFQGALYYLYNHSGSAGDIGKYDLSSTFDDDWGSTVPTGAGALTSNPHPVKVGNNDTFAFGNGRYVGTYDGTTLSTTALDLPIGSVVVDIDWVSDRWWITANRPSISGTNKNNASIFIWDGTATSWEAEIPVMGTAGASHVKNGVFFQFYQDISNTSGGYKLGYVSGNSISDLANFPSGLPSFYNTTDYKDFIIWSSGGYVYAFGSGDKDLPVRLFQIASDGDYLTAGGMVCPFGTPILSLGTGGASFRFAQFSGLTTDSRWKSLMFDITGNSSRPGTINSVRINFETLASSSRVDWKLLNNQGVTIYSDTISYAKLGAVTSAFYPLNGKVAENFRLEFDFSMGDTTNGVKIKNAKIYGSIK